MIDFLGTESVNRELERYKHSKSTAGKIYLDYYLKYKHPWWESLLVYLSLKKNDRLYLKAFDTRIMKLAEDSKKIQILKKNMPKSIIDKYRHDLLDSENAINYLFELLIPKEVQFYPIVIFKYIIFIIIVGAKI